MKVGQSTCQSLGPPRRGAQAVEREPLRRLRADSRQPSELCGEPLDRLRNEWHVPPPTSRAAGSRSEQAGRKPQAGGQLRHVGCRRLPRLLERVVAGGEGQVGEQLGAFLERLRLDGNREDLLMAVSGDRHHTASRGPGDGHVVELLLHLGHAGLHLLELLHHLLLVLHIRPRWAVYAPLADRGAPSRVSSWRRVAVTRLPANVSSTAWVTSLTDPDGPRGCSSPVNRVRTWMGRPPIADSASAITRRFSGSLICTWWKQR